MEARLTYEQISLAADYHDTCWTPQLEDMIDSAEELERINAARGENRTQEDLNAVLREAIRMRKVWEEPQDG